MNEKLTTYQLQNSGPALEVHFDRATGTKRLILDPKSDKVECVETDMMRVRMSATITVRISK